MSFLPAVKWPKDLSTPHLHVSKQPWTEIDVDIDKRERRESEQ